MAVGPDDSIVIANSDDHRISVIGPDGVVRTVAGTGEKGFSNDGVRATEAKLHGPLYVAVDSGGSIFFTETGNRRLRVICPNGKIQTIAGTGEKGVSGDGGKSELAINAKLAEPYGVAVSPDGTIVVADNDSVRMIGTDGVIRRIFAGEGGEGLGYTYPEGMPALRAKLGNQTIENVAVGPDSSILFTTESTVQMLEGWFDVSPAAKLERHETFSLPGTDIFRHMKHRIS